MGFSPDLIAKKIVQNAGLTKVPTMKMASAGERFDKLIELNQAGLSPRRIFDDLRDLIDSCDDDEKATKLNAIKFAAQLQELLVIEEQATRTTPTIVLNVIGNNTRVNAMLCPNFSE